MPIQFMRKLISPVSSCRHKLFFITILLMSGLSGSVRGTEVAQEVHPVQQLTAKYQIKASFFPLPVEAEIIVAQIEPDIYEARIKFESRFLKVQQSERARIQNCEVQLLAIESAGRRSGAGVWDETVEVVWPEQVIHYHYDKNKQVSYQSEYPPTGFATLFAHQFLSLNKNEQEKKLVYTQSKNGIPFSYQLLSREEEVKTRLSLEKIKTRHFIVLRGKNDEHPPSIWYALEEQGAFPVKMAIKLGVFNIEANLKEISGAGDNVNVPDFFVPWGCPSPSLLLL